MDEAWERAIEAALGGQAEPSASSGAAADAAPRALTLDGAVKCLQGRLPPPALLERYQSLEHLSIADIGVSSLEKFPRLPNLQRLILSDNRIAGGLEFLVEAGLDSLRDLDLSNNRIQYLEDLAPLAQLRLVSLDLYECPVTKIKDYRSRVFGLIRTLKYLDKMDSDENERPESDEEEDEEDEDEEEEDDPGSGEVDGDDRTGRLANGTGRSNGGVVDVDEDEESDAEEEETETSRGAQANASGHHTLMSNGFRLAAIHPSPAAGEEEDDDDEEDEYVDDDEEDDLVEEIDGDEGEEDDVVEVHDAGDSDEDVDGLEAEGEEEIDEDEDVDAEEDDEDVEDEEDVEHMSPRRLASTDGEIDGHEQGEADEDENGEIGEEDELGLDGDREFEEIDGEDDEEDDDLGEGFLMQPVVQRAVERVESDFDAHDEEEDGEDEVDEEEDDEDEVDDEDDLRSNGALQPKPSSLNGDKRKRNEEDDKDDKNSDDSRSSKHR